MCLSRDHWSIPFTHSYDFTESLPKKIKRFMFWPYGVKVNAKYLLDYILEASIYPANENIFHGHHWTQLKGTVPSHSNKVPKNLSKSNFWTSFLRIISHGFISSRPNRLFLFLTLGVHNPT